MGALAGLKDTEEARVFVTTRWSLILAGASSDGAAEQARAALADLCRIYWRPVFSFVCRRGYSTADAQDLTQDFFVMMLQTNWLQHADEGRGRFRSFLLKSLQNFIHHAREKDHAQKRGGAVQFVSWDDWMAEAPSQLSISSQTVETLPAETLFDLRWAATVVEHALRRLGEECEAKGRRRLFDALRGYLSAERSDTSYTDLASSLGVAESMIKKQLHNLRARYRWLLRAEVAHTVADPREVDAEIRYLCAILAAGT
jgi:RNA polymerase sigma-70 factor (ECF subfamily)